VRQNRQHGHGHLSRRERFDAAAAHDGGNVVVAQVGTQRHPAQEAVEGAARVRRGVCGRNATTAARGGSSQPLCREGEQPSRLRAERLSNRERANKGLEFRIYG
jgi:hypothetical protein